MDENTNEHRKIYERIGDLEVGMGKFEIEIPALKTGISALQNDMKNGFMNIGNKLDQTRTRAAEAQARGHKTAYGAMFFVISILVGLAIKLAMSGGS